MKKMIFAGLCLFASICFASTGNYLFLQTAASGQLKAIDNKQFTLTINAPKSFVTYFSDRPLRESGQMDLQKFLQFWTDKSIKNNFAINPPNAAVTVVTTNGQPLNFIATVIKGEYTNNTVIYTLKPEHPLTVTSMNVNEIDVFFDDIPWNPGGF